MAGLIDNVLDMARLQAGAASLNLQWHPLEELVGATLERLERRLAAHRVVVHLPDDLPLVHVDGVLIGQVLAQPARQRRQVHAGRHADLDLGRGRRGPGRRLGRGRRAPACRPARRSAIFEKFHRAVPEGTQSGVGLGLSIAKAILQAHGGHDRGREPAGRRRGLPLRPADSRRTARQAPRRRRGAD